MLWTLALLLACDPLADATCVEADTGQVVHDTGGTAAPREADGVRPSAATGEDTGEPAEVTLWLDADGDGYGSDGTVGPEVTITGPAEWVWSVIDTPRQWTELGGDCDDSRPEINPNLLDSDCD